MRAIRWNKRYLTGDPALDERNRALVALVSDLHAELSSAEHCQDMNELAERLAAMAKERLSRLPRDPGVAGDSETAIRNLLKRDFPLAALSTPACRQCGLCDLMSERVERWLSEGDGPNPDNS
jgi:hypothetical protein